MQKLIKPILFIAVTLLSLSTTSADAAVHLAPIFSNEMVLQRNKPVQIWGTALPQESVSVQIDNQSKTTVADSKGQWQVTLGRLSVAPVHKFSVRGKTNAIALSHVQVGDVWLCSGQSNMAFPLGASDFQCNDLSDLNKVNLRVFESAVNTNSQVENLSRRNIWKKANESSVKALPAIPFLFGRSVSLSQKIPIGIICAPCCGAPLETFLSDDTVKRIACTSNPLMAAHKLSENYHKFLQPILHFSMEGIIWYQGESNIFNASSYRQLFPAFISDLRKQMSAPELPFVFVQLPGFGYRQSNPVDSFWADLREAQLAACKLPNVYMVVSIDTTKEETTLHPKEKREIANRLARLAGEIISGDTAGATRPPEIKSRLVKGDAMVLAFDDRTGKLTTTDGARPRGFQLAGPDHKFYWAEATISGNAITITSDDVLDPQAVRYAWADNPDCNVEVDNLPLTPFRTDTWPTHPVLNPAAAGDTAS